MFSCQCNTQLEHACFFVLGVTSRSTSRRDYSHMRACMAMMSAETLGRRCRRRDLGGRPGQAREQQRRRFPADVVQGARRQEGVDRRPDHRRGLGQCRRHGPRLLDPVLRCRRQSRSTASGTGRSVGPHPILLTDDSVDDHSRYAIWLGTPVPLKLETRRRNFRSELLPTV